jgi:hypothetical protein
MKTQDHVPPIFDFLGDLKSLHDSTLETLRIFSGRRWDEIAPLDLQQGWDAFSFFDARAYAYYLPSVMTLSLLDFDKTHLSVLEIVEGLAASGDTIPQRAIMEHMSLDEAGLLFKWLNDIREQCARYGLCDEVDKAVANVRMCLIAKEQ